MTLERARGVRRGWKLEDIGGGDTENDRSLTTAAGVLWGREERVEEEEREEREERSSPRGCPPEDIERIDRLFDFMLKNDAVDDCGVAHLQVPSCPIYLFIYLFLCNFVFNYLHIYS